MTRPDSRFIIDGMPNPRLEELIALQTEIMAARIQAEKYFLILSSTRGSGRIAQALSLECLFHAQAVARAALILIHDLLEWAVEQSSVIWSTTDQIGWKLSLRSLEQCRRALEIDNTNQYLKLARVIVETLCKSSGLPYLGPLIELIDSIRETGEVIGVQSSEIRKTAQMLGTLDLFMMVGLGASQVAFMQVHALTRVPRDTDIDLSLAQLADRASSEAKTIVSGYIMESRQDCMEALDSPLKVIFPNEGMWPDSLSAIT